MKIQLDGQHLRLRINEDELARLLDGDPLHAVSRLSPQCYLQTELGCSEHGPSWQAQSGRLQLLLDRSELLAYVERLPCRDGLNMQFALEGNEPIAIEFSVDVRDSTRKRLRKT